MEVMEASREVAAARKRAAESERALHAKHEVGNRIHLNASSSFSKEIAQATRRAAECERCAENARLEKEEAERSCRDLNLKVIELKVKLKQNRKGEGLFSERKLSIIYDFLPCRFWEPEKCFEIEGFFFPSCHKCKVENKFEYQNLLRNWYSRQNLKLHNNK